DSRIPLTNNQAERTLRHLVLKRKISFGSLTKRKADNLSVLLSVLMSLKQRHQAGFFGEYLRV
ncbi:MAG: transposase, partial [Candidatus Yonathbacteria bacterium]|nr:transposase [Candidatus Yonathbacteria bacterium]